MEYLKGGEFGIDPYLVHLNEDSTLSSNGASPEVCCLVGEPNRLFFISLVIVAKVLSSGDCIIELMSVTCRIALQIYGTVYARTGRKILLS